MSYGPMTKLHFMICRFSTKVSHETNKCLTSVFLSNVYVCCGVFFFSAVDVNYKLGLRPKTGNI